VLLVSFSACSHQFASWNDSLSAATGFSAKITRFTKNFTRSEKQITRLKTVGLKFVVLLEMLYLFNLLPKNLYISCKFAKIDHVEASKSSYSQYNLQAFLKSRKWHHSRVFRAINLTVNKLFPLQCSCWEMKILPWPILQQLTQKSTEVQTMRKSN